MKIKFTVPGQPVAQGRPKFTTIGGHARAYDPKKSVDYKKIVAYHAMQHKPKQLLKGELEVEILIFKECLKSFSRKNMELAELGQLRPITKPDADNYAKGPLDAMKGIIWKDDGQIVDLIARKFYSSRPRIEITVRTLGEIQESLF